MVQEAWNLPGRWVLKPYWGIPPPISTCNFLSQLYTSIKFHYHKSSALTSCIRVERDVTGSRVDVRLTLQTLFSCTAYVVPSLAVRKHKGIRQCQAEPERDMQNALGQCVISPTVELASKMSSVVGYFTLQRCHCVMYYRTSKAGVPHKVNETSTFALISFCCWIEQSAGWR